MQTVAEMWLVVQLTGSGVSVGLTAACSSCRSCCSARWRRARRPLRQAPAADAHPDADGAARRSTLWALTVSGADRSSGWSTRSCSCAGWSSRRQPAAPGFVMELVGPRPGRQRGLAQQRDRPHRPHRRPGVRRRRDRHRSASRRASRSTRLVRARCWSRCAGWTGALLPSPRAAPRPRQVRAALRRGARARPELRIPLAMMVVVGTLSFNFQVLLPLFARLHLARDGVDLRAADERDGRRLGRRRARRRARAAASRPRLLAGSARCSASPQLCAAAAPTLRAADARARSRSAPRASRSPRASTRRCSSRPTGRCAGA